MRGIRRLEKHEDLVRLLADHAHPDTGRSIFPTMRELMCFSAVLGFQESKRVSLVGKALEVDPRVWRSDDFALDLLFLVPLAAEHSLELARPEAEDQLVLVFEEFANGGFEILRSWLAEKPEDAYGDRALLAALQKYGYLSAPKNVDSIIDQISFD